jgi:type IX secretion system PorP/SprF family membrane protein
MRHFSLLVILGLCFAQLQAQDRSFTQLQAIPVDLNPALTGSVEGSYRVTMIYHDQWRGILGNPYQSYGVFGDLKFDAGGRKDFAGAGVSIVADRTGVFNYNTTQMNVHGAFHKFLNARQVQYLSAGMYLGLIQRSVNYENLVFDDQFNGLDAYSFGTREDLPENNLAHGDLGIGLNYALEASKTFSLSAGIAFAHLFSPSVSFFKRTEGYETVEDITLQNKLTAYGSASIGFNESISLIPRLAYFSQGPSTMIQFMPSVRFGMNAHNNNAFHAGAGVRFAKELESLAPSSMMALAGFELGSFLLGLSYEYSFDDLANERLGQGIFELGITFIGDYENTDNFCPTF